MRRVILSYEMVNENICTNFLPGLVEKGLSVEALRCAPTGPRSGHSLVQIKGPTEICDKELADLDGKLSNWCSVSLSRQGPGEYMALMTNRDCAICHIIPSSGCFVESARGEKGGRVVWTILGPDTTAVRRLVATLKETGREVVIHSSRNLSPFTGLTCHQMRALQLAFDRGYYDIPQRVTLEQMAPLMNCSKSTLNIVLRRAVRKLLAEHLCR